MAHWYDYEYERNGTANICVGVEPKGNKRIARVTRRRTKKRTAYLIRYVVMKKYQTAKKVIIVADNLNTHNSGVLKDVFGKEEGERIGRICVDRRNDRTMADHRPERLAIIRGSAHSDEQESTASSRENSPEVR